MLLSQMPPRREKKTKRSHESYWDIGDCLSWRICSEELKNHPSYGKYALVRVVDIDRSPICRLLPEAGYNDDVVMGVYEWIGEDIPKYHNVKELRYMVLEHYKSPFISATISHLINTERFEKLKPYAEDIIAQAESQYDITCFAVSMASDRKLMKDHVQCIGNDDSFQYKIPDFFDTNVTHMIYGTACVFEKRLAKMIEMMQMPIGISNNTDMR